MDRVKSSIRRGTRTSYKQQCVWRTYLRLAWRIIKRNNGRTSRCGRRLLRSHSLVHRSAPLHSAPSSVSIRLWMCSGGCERASGSTFTNECLYFLFYMPPHPHPHPHPHRPTAITGSTSRNNRLRMPMSHMTQNDTCLPRFDCAFPLKWSLLFILILFRSVINERYRFFVCVFVKPRLHVAKDVYNRINDGWVAQGTRMRSSLCPFGTQDTVRCRGRNLPHYHPTTKCHKILFNVSHNLAKNLVS